MALGLRNPVGKYHTNWKIIIYEEFYQPKLYNNEQSETTHPEHNAHVLLLNLICANRMFGNYCRC